MFGLCKKPKAVEVPPEEKTFTQQLEESLRHIIIKVYDTNGELVNEGLVPFVRGSNGIMMNSISIEHEARHQYRIGRVVAVLLSETLYDSHQNGVLVMKGDSLRFAKGSIEIYTGYEAGDIYE